MIRSFVATIGILTLSGCGILGIGTVERTLEIAPYKARCVGLFETLCLQAREAGETEFRNLFQTPRGFSFEWGHGYVIRVLDRKIDNPPADGSANELILESVRSRVPVAEGTRFELEVVTEEGLDLAAPGRWLLFGGPESLACPSEAPCDQLQDLIGSLPRILFVLEFSAAVTDPFIIRDWTGCTELHGPCG